MPTAAAKTLLSSPGTLRWAQWRTCLPSRHGEKSWMLATDLFSFGAVLYEMATGQKWLFPATLLRLSTTRFCTPRAQVPAARLNPETPAKTGRSYQQGAGERPYAPLPKCRRHPHRFATAESATQSPRGCPERESRRVSGREIAGRCLFLRRWQFWGHWPSADISISIAHRSSPKRTRSS